MMQETILCMQLADGRQGGVTIADTSVNEQNREKDGNTPVNLCNLRF
jgi:hypothetical protein